MKKISQAFIIIMVIIFTFCSCGSNAAVDEFDVLLDDDFSYEFVYSDEYWESNVLPISVSFTDDDIDSEDLNDAANTFEYDNCTELDDVPDYVYDTLREAKTAIQTYINDRYSIDLSKRLSALTKIVLFAEDIDSDLMTLGYVEDDSYLIHINVMIINDPDTLRSVMVHEILHALGLRHSEHDLQLLVEGLTDALTEQIIIYSDEIFVPSDAYNFQRTLAAQMLIVDDELIKNFLLKKDFNFAEYINTKLSNVELMIYDGVEINQDKLDLAHFLDSCIFSIFYQIDAEWQFDFEMQAQAIVGAYCKTFNPTEEQIEEIRCYYVYFDFEYLTTSYYNVDSPVG